MFDAAASVGARRFTLEGLFQPMHLAVILVLAIFIFGPRKLPELGKGLGDGIRSFKRAFKGEEHRPDPS